MTISPLAVTAARRPAQRWLALGGWLLIVLAQLAYFVFDLAADYAAMLAPCAGVLGSAGACNFLAISRAEFTVLASWGLTPQAYARAMLVAPVILLLVYWALAGVILWRQGASRLGMTVSLALIVLPIYTVSGDSAWAANDPRLVFLALAVSILGAVIVVTFLYLIPDGRFSPGWAYIPLVATILAVSGLTLEINGIITLSAQARSLLEGTAVALALLGGGLQIHRYRRDSSAAEHQQVKWIVSGIVTYVLAVLVWVLIFGGVLAIPAGSARLLANVGGWFFLNTFMLLILPATMTIAIMRYRLWDIDLILRKTLTYALLSGLLLFVYFGLVILLQSALNAITRQQSSFAIVISTLAIAALFTPLRKRVQAFIDRRFFRKKYDAQQVLARFAQTAREEVSLETLASELNHVVQETMQPEGATIWLKKRRG